MLRSLDSGRSQVTQALACLSTGCCFSCPWLCSSCCHCIMTAYAWSRGRLCNAAVGSHLQAESLSLCVCVCVWCVRWTVDLWSLEEPGLVRVCLYWPTTSSVMLCPVPVYLYATVLLARGMAVLYKTFPLQFPFLLCCSTCSIVLHSCSSVLWQWQVYVYFYVHIWLFVLFKKFNKYYLFIITYFIVRYIFIIIYLFYYLYKKFK